MSAEFYQPIRHTSIDKHNDMGPTRAVRLYCEQYGRSWALQVRGPLKLANGRDSASFIVATASLSVEEMEALRDAISAHLGEARACDPAHGCGAGHSVDCDIARAEAVRS